MKDVLFHSLPSRVLAANLALVTLTVAGLASLFLWTYSRDLDRQLSRQADQMAGFIAGQSQFPMLVGDGAALDRVARNAVASDAVLFVELSDGQGGHPVYFGRDGGTHPAAGRRFIEAKRYVERPIQLGSMGWEGVAAEQHLATPAVLGTVRLGLSTDREHAARVRIVWVTAGMAFVSLLLAGVVQALQLRGLLRPLQALTEFTGRVAAGDLSGRAEVVRLDEVGRLTIAFNRMVERLGATLVSKEAAEAGDAAKSRFLSTMSHELRTPLNAVIGYSQLLQEECHERGLQWATEDLSRIERAGNMLLALVTQVLDFSRAEAGKIELHLESFDVRSAIEDVIGTVEPMAVRNHDRLWVQLGDWNTDVHTDLTCFRQSLLNLVANACKFTQGGDVSVEVSREPVGNEDYIVVSVKDTGIGISPEQQGKLFQAFTQGDSSTTRKYGGSGLGLAISRRMCRLVGGDISLESELGRGSNFVMRIPARCKEKSPREEPDGAAG